MDATRRDLWHPDAPSVPTLARCADATRGKRGAPQTPNARCGQDAAVRNGSKETVYSRWCNQQPLMTKAAGRNGPGGEVSRVGSAMAHQHRRGRSWCWCARSPPHVGLRHAHAASLAPYQLGLARFNGTSLSWRIAHSLHNMPVFFSYTSKPFVKVTIAPSASLILPKE